MTDRKEEDDFLDRFDIDIGEIHDIDDMRKAMLKNWEHAYSPTDKQVGALMNAVKRNPDYTPIKPTAKRTKLFTRTPLGRVIPRLASVGIKRKTYIRSGQRVTRYIVPGRAGLFGLKSARQIFGQL